MTLLHSLTHSVLSVCRLNRKQNILINCRVGLCFAAKMVHIMTIDEKQEKNLATMNGFTNGEAKTARYRLGAVARTEIRQYQLPNQRDGQIANMPNAMQLSRRIRGERV